ncbi:zinc finger protein 425-like [Ctenocephalides felis]|uniref:zinc finger protein 425-like n=1 Tax=Ctenocephalides felis TaxID=7515 RepID=UPI000E6E1816|nr:zinc finger protein 425-like [Ctenocephalides felis]
MYNHGDKQQFMTKPTSVVRYGFSPKALSNSTLLFAGRDPLIFYDMRALALSMRQHHCAACGRSYKHKKHLTSHKRYECGKQPQHQCPYYGFLLGNGYFVPYSNICYEDVINLKHTTGEKNFNVEGVSKSMNTNMIPGLTFFDNRSGSRSMNKYLGRNSIPVVYTSDGDMLHQCPDCPRNYRHATGWYRHRKYECGKEKLFECLLCHQKFHQKSNLKTHSMKHTRKYKFGGYSDWSFYQIEQETYVRKSQQGTKNFFCPNCKKGYVHGRGLHQHMKYECGKEPQFFCPQCPYKCHLKGNLARHYFYNAFPRKIFETPYNHSRRSFEETKKYVCPNCRRSYVYPNGLSQHMKFECGKEPQFACPMCPYKCHLKGNLIILTRVITPILNIHGSSKITKDSNNLYVTAARNHIHTNVDSRSILDMNVGKNLNLFAQNALTNAIEKKVLSDTVGLGYSVQCLYSKCNKKAKQFFCLNCHKGYVYERSLKQHIRYECGKEPQFACSQCPYKSHVKGNLKMHYLRYKAYVKQYLKRLHTSIVSDGGDRSILRAFAANSNKNSGGANNENSEKFRCPNCPTRAYKHRGSLRFHLKYECGKEPQFGCLRYAKFCKDKTKSNLQKLLHLLNSFQQHYLQALLRANTSITRQRLSSISDGSQKVYRCPNCPTRTYKHRCSLRLHLQYECGKEPQFACSRCSYKSHQKGNLLSHMQLCKVSESRFACQYCEHRTYYNHSMVKHVFSAHGVTLDKHEVIRNVVDKPPDSM